MQRRVSVLVRHIDDIVVPLEEELAYLHMGFGASKNTMMEGRATHFVLNKGSG